MKNNLKKNTLLLSIGTILNKGLLFVFIPLFSSWLSTEDYGTFDLLCTYSAMLIPVLSLSTGDGIFRLGIEEDKKVQKQYITAGLIIHIIGLLLLALFIIILAFILKEYILIPFYFMVLGELINKYLQSYLRAIKKLNIYSFTSILSTIITFIFTTIFIRIYSLGVYGIIYGYAVGYIISNIIIIIISNFKQYLTTNIPKKRFKELFKYSIPLIPNSLSWWVVNVSDRIIINLFINPVANGIYAIANKIPSLCTSIFSVFNVAWQETAIESRNLKDRVKYYDNVYNKMISILVSLCILILSTNFLLFNHIFDNRYIEGHKYVGILMAAVIFNISAQFFGGIQISLKQTTKNGLTTVLGAISNIFIHMVLIKRIGLYAAAISTLVSNMIILFLRKNMLKDYIKISINFKNYIIISIYAYIMICSMFYTKISYLLNISNLLLSLCVFAVINKNILINVINKIKKKVKV